MVKEVDLETVDGWMCALLAPDRLDVIYSYSFLQGERGSVVS
jgi:hypothetical protein